MTPTRLSAELAQGIRAAILAHPDAYGRSRVIYNVVRECYDAVKSLDPYADTDERASAGRISDEASEHEARMERASR